MPAYGPAVRLPTGYTDVAIPAARARVVCSSAAWGSHSSVTRGQPGCCMMMYHFSSSRLRNRKLAKWVLPSRDQHADISSTCMVLPSGGMAAVSPVHSTIPNTVRLGSLWFGIVQAFLQGLYFLLLCTSTRHLRYVCGLPQ
eukprot:GHUV01040509.1.p1 GENE.GHUV01040509.1~~GHUV01040509.1.p1  ORF type:complete len:141 (+),score=3.98 GHUV01040509.1:179-601(+)